MQIDHESDKVADTIMESIQDLKKSRFVGETGGFLGVMSRSSPSSVLMRFLGVASFLMGTSFSARCQGNILGMIKRPERVDKKTQELAERGVIEKGLLIGIHGPWTIRV